MELPESCSSVFRLALQLQTGYTRPTLVILSPNECKEHILILVTVRDNEPFEKALRRFRRKVEREGILQT